MKPRKEKRDVLCCVVKRTPLVCWLWEGRQQPNGTCKICSCIFNTAL